MAHIVVKSCIAIKTRARIHTKIWSMTWLAVHSKFVFRTQQTRTLNHQANWLLGRNFSFLLRLSHAVVRIFVHCFCCCYCMKWILLQFIFGLWREKKKEERKKEWMHFHLVNINAYCLIVICHRLED